MKPPLWSLFVSFLKMGAVLIGGGYALLPLLEREVVERRKWARSEEMLDLYALAQMLPGVIAVNTAMLVGNRLRGFRGTLAAAAGLTAVPFALIAAYAAAYGMLRDTAVFARLLSGIQPAVAGMIMGLGVDMVRKVSRDTRSFALACVSALAVLLFDPPFGLLIAASVAAGLVFWGIGIRKAAKAASGAEVRG